MNTYEIKLLVEGIQGQVVEHVTATNMTQARQIILAKYSGRRISSFMGPNQIG